jgi:N-methylhydantoinase B/oxoprolinase/acetone carboxylase alpha subunit
MPSTERETTRNDVIASEAATTRFLAENPLFLGPDPEIIRNHRIEPRSSAEERALAGSTDDHLISMMRGRLQAALDETHTMLEAIASAPGSKWGDVVTGVYTQSGDLSIISSRGILGFASTGQYPVKFIRRHWVNDPSVGAEDGDVFIYNDTRYGTIHNPDQSMCAPVYWEGELVCWISCTVHEGENGSTEPGGLAAAAQSVYDEGLKMPPFKIYDKFVMKRDLVTFLQNMVRDPRLMIADIKTKAATLFRLRERILELLGEHGPLGFIAMLRRNLEDVAIEARRRIAEMPDGTVRTHAFLDSTLLEPGLVKINFAITVRGNEMTVDLRGSSPEISNRALNSHLPATKVAIMTSIYMSLWPDLPHNMAVLDPITFLTDQNSILDPSYSCPGSLSVLPIFKLCTIPAMLWAKLTYGLPNRYTAIVAPQYNQTSSFIWGGITQHNELTGNVCPDVNGMGGGARSHADGEHALSPCFGYMADLGEQEISEEEMPLIRLVSQTLTKDRVGFGKYRGGMGYEQVVSVRGTPFLGLITGTTGSFHSATYGLFGGYGCAATPLCKIKGANVFETLRDRPHHFVFDIVDMMNNPQIEGAVYSTHAATMAFEPVNEGEVYALCQGSGGGYGDVLEREPEAVLKDIDEGLLSTATAFEIYRVRLHGSAVDEAATEEARSEERRARIARGRPYADFVNDWVRSAPPETIAYHGSWDDPRRVFGGPPNARREMEADALQGMMMPNPYLEYIRQLEGALADLQRGGERP